MGSIGGEANDATVSKRSIGRRRREGAENPDWTSSEALRDQGRGDGETLGR